MTFNTDAQNGAAPRNGYGRPGTGGWDDWSALRVFLGYRLLLALTLLLVSRGMGGGPLGGASPALFGAASQLYVGLTLLAVVPAMLRIGDREPQALLAIYADILLLTVMMHASGGVGSGLGILIAVSVALGSMSLAGRNALLLAALASLAVLTERVYAHFAGDHSQAAYVQAGLLGLAFFAMAFFTNRLSRRLHLTQQIADLRGHDLANMAELNEHVIEQMESGLIVVDEDRDIRLINDAAWRLLGTPDAARDRPLPEASPELAHQLDCWLARPMAELPAFRPLRDGRDLKARFNRLGEHGMGILIVLDDVARTEARAQQMKLASLGRLTAGIAHEVRNPLGAISHAAQLLDESPGLQEADRRLIEIIGHNSERVNEVIENILRLSRRQDPQMRPLRLLPWLEEQAAQIRQNLQLSDTQLTVDIDPAGTTVNVDPGQLRQILDMLCENACRHYHQDSAQLRIDLVGGISRESRGPFLACQDNGPGIPRERASQLFEPFFTTRNDGTGLGLYIARQLSEANRIRLEYLPLPDSGSCFRLTFPSPGQQD